MFLFGQNRFKEAKKQFGKVVDDVYYAHRAAAFRNLGLCSLALEEIDEAEEAFRRSAAMDRTESIARLEIAHILFIEGKFPQAQKYLDQYRKLVRTATPRSLLLGVKLAQKFDDKDRVASYSMVLRNLYPASAEYLELKQASHKK